MASWRDGPEYAPHERPEAFVDPKSAPLAPPAVSQPVVAAPAEEPMFAPPQQPTPDLASLIPSAQAGRDPRQAFEVVSTPLTSTTPPAPTAWGSAHATTPVATAAPAPPAATPWTPQQPIPAAATPVQASIPMPPPMQPHAQVNPAPFPAPSYPPYFPPPAPGQRFGQAPPQVTFSQVWQAVTPAVFIALIGGALLNWLSVLMLLMAYGLASRVRYQRQVVRIVFGSSVGIVAAVGGATLWLDGFYLTSAWKTASGTAQALCWVLPFIIALVVAVAMTRGERPEP